MKHKRLVSVITALILAVTMTASLAACSGKPGDPDGSAVSEATPAEAASAEATIAESAEGSAEEQKVPAQEADCTEAFQAYLTMLNQAKTQIRGYGWQLKTFDSDDQAESRPVAFADVCGDSTPEMIYMGKNMSTTADIADCSVITYLDGPFTAMSDAVDGWAGAGTQYYLFTVKDDKALYCYNACGSEHGNFRIDRYAGSDEENGVMEKEEYLYRREDDTGTTDLQMNGKDVSIAAYNTARSEVLNNVDKVLMKGANGVFMEDDVKAIMEAKENISMTLEEAFEFLGGKYDEEELNKPDYTQEDLNAVKGKYSQYYRPGEAEITSDGKFILHSFDFTTGEEIDVTAYQIIGIKKVLGGGCNVGYQKDGEQDYITVYMKGEVSPGNIPPEYVDTNNCLKVQLFQFSNAGVPFICIE